MNPIQAYMPTHALQQSDVESILQIALPEELNDRLRQRYDYHHSRRTMLYFLLSMRNDYNENRIKDMIHKLRPNFNWSEVENNFNDLQKIVEPYQKQYRAEKYKSYWELQFQGGRSGAQQAKSYILKSRPNGFQSDELKLYWNYEQIRQLGEEGRFKSVTDENTHKSLLEHPVSKRLNTGEVEYKISGIEKAVFAVPEGKQVIVLDFADERMPGGYFLENARTQEEVILYNSDGYRALLDLKYQMMNGGYMLPEYGVAYIKNVQFYSGSTDQRQADVIAAACYDLSIAGEGLYKLPSENIQEELRSRTKQKFQAIIASAVANSRDGGKETYLLLGPIGTGAFQNDITMIAKIFSEVLNNPLMDSKAPIRKAFERIWFVSIDSLDEFQSAFESTPLFSKF